jgi:hypothetical protein
MNVVRDGEHATIWDIRVLEPADDDRFTLHHEAIHELGVALDRVRTTLANGFELLLEEDDQGLVPTDESPRAYFVYGLRE